MYSTSVYYSKHTVRLRIQWTSENGTAVESNDIKASCCETRSGFSCWGARDRIPDRPTEGTTVDEHWMDSGMDRSWE